MSSTKVDDFLEIEEVEDKFFKYMCGKPCMNL